MEIRLSKHARENITERKISFGIVKDVLLEPDKVEISKKGRKIAQKAFGNRVLRVIYKETDKAYIVVTVYYSKVGRY